MIHCHSLQLPAAHLARLDAQPVAHLVGQVRVAASTEHLEVCLNVVLASSCPAQTPHFLGNNKNTSVPPLCSASFCLDQAPHTKSLVEPFLRRCQSTGRFLSLAVQAGWKP